MGTWLELYRMDAAMILCLSKQDQYNHYIKVVI